MFRLDVVLIPSPLLSSPCLDTPPHSPHSPAALQDKYNIWVALLNLEHGYGSASSLESAFAQGVQESKGKYLHLHLASLYEGAGDLDAACAVLERALKKYKYSKKVWGAFQVFELRRGAHDAAKKLLQRSLQSLSRHKHVEVISRYASAEFDVGSADRGRVVFEDLLASCPKRSDLWHVYIDKEVKAGSVSQARQLLERLLAQRLNVKNAKAAFKKYLDVERRFGDAASQQAVADKARSYVEGML
jgi:rRNA biogenesis protein RRP5